MVRLQRRPRPQVPPPRQIPEVTPVAATFRACPDNGRVALPRGTAIPGCGLFSSGTRDTHLSPNPNSPPTPSPPKSLATPHPRPAQKLPRRNLPPPPLLYRCNLHPPPPPA